MRFRRHFVVVSCAVLLPAAAWAGIPSQQTSTDASVEPQRFTWTRPARVEAALFASVNRPQPRVSSMFLSVNDDPEGDMPRDVAFTADGAAAVMACRDTDNLTFFDVGTQAIVATVGVGDFPVHVAVTPDNHYAVCPNVFSNDVSVVDVATHTLVANIPVTGEQPYRVAITPDSRYVVVGVINDAVSSSFSIIDLTTLSEVHTFASTPQGVIGFFATPEPGIVGNLFTQFALSPDGTTIVLPDGGGDQVAIYDRATGAPLALVPTAAAPAGVDISPDGSFAVVSHENGTKRISVIDLGTLSVAHSYPTADALYNELIRVTPDGAYAVASLLNDVIFVDLATGAETARINTGTPGDIEFSFDGQYAFVSNYNARVIDLASQSLVKTLTFASCYNAAASPTELRAVALNNRFRENIHLYNIDGAAGAFEGFALSGEPPEGDSPRNLAVSPDGRIAVVCNNVSRNVEIVDLTTDTIRSYIDVGDRPLDAAISPDGATAVVCATDENYVRVIDLNTDSVVASLYIYRRPSRVRISPDGQWAYVLNVAGSDMISFIRLDGPASSIVSQQSAGQTGSIGSFISGIELSHDGATLAVCDSFNDRLRLYDTATRTQVASVPVGDFPLTVAFSPDDSFAYVANAIGDNVSVVSVAGSGSALVGNYGSVDYPQTVDVDPAGTHFYVGNVGNNAGIRVFDAATYSVVKTITFASGTVTSTFLSPTDGTLYVATSVSELKRVAAAGAASHEIDTWPLTATPWQLGFANEPGLAVVAEPSADGLDIVQFGCAVDLNADRTTDLADLAILLAHYPTTSGATHADGDIDDDGDVDLADLALLLAAFGQDCP